jgi:hypothetical protein
VGKSVAELVADALDRFDAPDTSVASLVRTTLRVAWRRKDYATVVRLLPETFDLTAVTGTIDRADWTRARAELAAVLGAEAAARETERLVRQQYADRAHPDGSGRIAGHSIDQLERFTSWFLHEREMLALQLAAAAPGAHGDLVELSVTVEQGLAQYQTMVARVRQSVHTLLVATELELVDGEGRPGTVHRAVDYVTSRLREVSPAALRELQAADDALGRQGELSGRAQAATSCRRAMEVLADALYPPRPEPVVGLDGVERGMRSNQPVNRLTQFAQERSVGGPAGDVLLARLREFNRLLGRQYNLASKGVHEDLTVEEVEVLVTWSWMLAAQLLRLHDGTTTLDATPDAPPLPPIADDGAPLR